MLRNMKNLSKIYIYASVLLIILFNGCTDVLEEQPRTILTPGAFETGKGLQGGLTAAYAHFRRYYASEPGMNMTVYGTDEYTHAQQVNSPPFAIYSSITPDAGELGSAWNNAYPAINTCNGIIQLGPNATDLQEEEKKQLIAEAKFIRANWYFILVRTFGGATLDLGSGPLAFNTTPTNDLVRASENEVYAAIVQDLVDAVDDLPESRPTTPGRAWKASALHLLAKVYLARGWKDNSNSDFQDAYNNAVELINNREVMVLVWKPTMPMYTEKVMNGGVRSYGQSNGTARISITTCWIMATRTTMAAISISGSFMFRMFLV
jgi:starch-binding outer membrane protein, SusD/RagB family